MAPRSSTFVSRAGLVSGGVTSATLCVTAETELATASGPRAAVAIAPGETIRLGPGVTRTVRDVSRTVLVRDAGLPANRPIRVAMGSLGEGLPETDIVVAADQVLPLGNGVGAPARLLVDGAVIRRATPQGALDLVMLHLDAPLAERAAEAVLPGLVERLVATRLPSPGRPLGSIDEADPARATGWAVDPARPGQPLLLTLLVDGIPRGLVLADHYREDLDRNHAGGGHHAFHAEFTPALSRRERHLVTLRRALDGAPIDGAAWLVERAPAPRDAIAALDTLSPEARARALSAALLALGEAARG